MDLSAWFINPDGLIIFCESKHISKIIDNPEIFNLSIENIKSVYKSYNEAMCFEGYARQNLISDLLQKGWIRIRIRTEQHSGKIILFQVFQLDNKTLKHIVRFSEQITSDFGINGIRLPVNTPVIIKNISGFQINQLWQTLNDFIISSK